jgi:hypothetical protein
MGVPIADRGAVNVRGVGRVQMQVLGSLCARSSDAPRIAEDWPGLDVTAVHRALRALYVRKLIEPRGWRGVARTWGLTQTGFEACVDLGLDEGGEP